jgi:hypothetical protein
MGIGYVLFDILSLYIIVGIVLSIKWGYTFGNREHSVNTALDVVLWPFAIYYLVKFKWFSKP